MASDSTNLDARLRLIVDPTAAKQVQDFFKSVSAQAKASQQAVSGTGAAGGLAAASQKLAAVESERLTTNKDLVKAIGDQNSALAEQETQLGDLANAAKPLQALQRPTRLQFSLSQFGGLASTLGLPGVAGGLAGASDIAGAEEAITQLKIQIPQLAQRLTSLGGIFSTLTGLGADVAVALGASSGGIVAALGGILAVAVPIVAIVGGLALALNAMQKAADDATKGIVDSANTFRDISQQSATMTKPDVQKNLDDAISQMNVNQQLADQAKENLAQYENTHTIAQRSADDFGGTWRGLQQVVADSSAALATSQDAVAGWSVVIGSNTVAVNTAKQAAEDAADANNAELAAKVELAKFTEKISTATTTQLKQMLAENNAEALAIGANAEGATGKQAQLFHDRLVQLNAEADAINNLLNPAMSSLAGFIKQNAEAFQKFADNAKNLASQYQEQQATAMDARLNAAVREAQDFGISRGRELRDFNLQQQRASQDAQLTQQKANLDTQRRVQDLFDRIRKIMLDALEKMGDAVADRDALSYIKAQRDRDKQLAELNQQTALDDQRRKEDQALADQAAAIARQRQQEDFARRQQDENADRALRLIRLQQDNNEQDRIREVAYQRQQQQLLQQLNAQTGILGIMGQNFTTFLNNAREAIAASSRTYPTGLLVNNPVFNNGVPYGSGNTLNLNIQGATQQNVIATSAAEAGRVFGNVLKLLGAR